MMTLEAIEARITALKTQKLEAMEQLRATILALDGAMQDCEYWKGELQKIVTANEVPQPVKPPVTPAELTMELTPEELAVAPLGPVPPYEASIVESRPLEVQNVERIKEPDAGSPGVQHQRAKANGHDRGVRHNNHNGPQRSYVSRLGKYS